MKLLADLIKTGIDKEHVVFVFPAETAAEYWRKAALSLTGRTALRSRRFISWDSFKEDITSHERAEKPVNSILRRLFAAALIRRNSGGPPFFSTLIPAEYSSNSRAFTDMILRVLPELKFLISRMEEEHALSDELESDYRLLFREYSKFLLRNNLFEPGWDEIELKNISNEYIIIFPELVEDFNRYSSLLASMKCRLLKDDSRQKHKFRLFENTFIEVDAVLKEIMMHIESGIEDIAVTSADDGTAELLKERARLYGVPLNPRQGRPLAEYPGGRLPELLRDCRQSGFSIASMKNLLLFRAFIWKDEELAAGLIRFGIENRCLKNTPGHLYGDVWKTRLKSAGEKGLYDFYIKLKTRIEKITGSSDFTELSREFQVFINAFLDTDPDIWDKETEQVFQRSREVLSDLREVEQQVAEVEITDPLGLWIEILQEKIYVKRRDEPGINLYPYRVSAGIKPAVHFVIGLSHDSSNIISKAFGFMTEQQRKGIDAAEQNMSEDFLNAYSKSGEKVWFSCSTETPGGVALPPAVFLEDDVVERIDLREENAGTPFVNENLWWAGGLKSAPPALTLFQKAGFEYARKTFMLPGEFDATETSFPQGPVRDMLTEQLSEEEGLLRTSASAMNSWLSCPFSFLFSKVLDVGADEYVLKPEDPMTAGLLLHEILHDFFAILKKQDQPFYGADIETYKELIKSVSEKVFSSWEKAENRFFGPAWDALKRKASVELSRYPEAETEYYEGMKPVYLEEWFDFVLEQEKIKAGGFIDRISGNSEGVVIIDYKKSRQKMSKAKFIQYDEDDSLQTPVAGFQLPFYILLASEAGMNVIGTSYYGIAEAQHYPVTGMNGVIDEKEAGELCSLTLTTIREMAESIRGGNFQAPDRCDGCDYRAVCRKKFKIRWYG